MCFLGIGCSSSSSSSATTTNNADNRVAVQDGTSFSNANGNNVSINSSDAVKAIAAMGADTLKNIGGSIVDINKTTTDLNKTTWDKTLTMSTKLIESLTDNISKSYGMTTDLMNQGLQLAGKTVDSFQPTDNKTQDTVKLAMIVAAVAAVYFAIGKK